MSTARRIPVISAVLLFFAVYSACMAWGCDIPEIAEGSQGQSAAPPIRYHVNDCHLHFVDLVQNTDGMDALIREMDRLGVDHTMLTGFPVVKKWDIIDSIRPTYYLDNDSSVYYYTASDSLLARAVLALSPEKRRRIHPFICSFNPTDRNAVDHIERMIEWYPGVWEGIGEVLTRHNFLSHMIGGEQGRANHPALDAVYELAAKKKLPVNLHSDMGPAWLNEPLYLGEVEAAIKKHPNTRFFWAHGGYARNLKIEGAVNIYRRLLTIYPNLSIDLAGSFFGPIIVPNGKVDMEFVKLIEEYPDRFTLGTDRVGHFGVDYEKRITQTYALLDALKPETAVKVARENFLRSLPPGGVK